jgi:hypothetical protein
MDQPSKKEIVDQALQYVSHCKHQDVTVEKFKEVIETINNFYNEQSKVHQRDIRYPETR